MVENQEHERNNAAYQRLKQTINQTYPKGWFVAIADDRILGAAGNFRDLEKLLRAQGLDPRRILVVEAGIALPEYITIFA